MKTFKAWWNSPLSIVNSNEPSGSTQRYIAEQAWNFAYEMQENRIKQLEEALESRQQRHLDSIRALREANEQITRIAADNVQLRKELESYQEPAEERAVKYIATVNEVCEDEADAFYMGTLDDIMEWCEDWNHCINDVKFYRLGDEVRVSFVDMGKETRFGGGKSDDL